VAVAADTAAGDMVAEGTAQALAGMAGDMVAAGTAAGLAGTAAE
jgi:hypothetical protein